MFFKDFKQFEYRRKFNTKTFLLKERKIPLYMLVFLIHFFIYVYALVYPIKIITKLSSTHPALKDTAK